MHDRIRIWNHSGRILVSVALGLMLVFAGCTNDDPDDNATPTVSESAAGDEAVNDADRAADDAGPDSVENADETEEDSEESADDSSTNDAVLGPTDAPESWAYLTDMYEEDGWWYVVVDYIQVTGPEEDLQFVNQNPLLRTFPVAHNAELRLLDGTGGPDYDLVSATDFDLFQEQPGEELIQVTPQGGWIMKLTQWWSP